MLADKNQSPVEVKSLPVNPNAEGALLVENASKPEDVIDTRTPEEIEADILRQEEQAALDSTNKLAPEDLAAMYFNMVYPTFKDKVHGLYAKDLKALISALVQYPLIEDAPQFKQKATAEAFKMGVELFNAKFIMRTKAEFDFIQKNLDTESKLGDNEVTPEAEKVEVTTVFEQGENIDEQSKENNNVE